MSASHPPQARNGKVRVFSPRTVIALSATGLVAAISLTWPGSRPAAAASAPPAAQGGGLPEKVTFNRDIRPILSDKCFACHGFDAKTREAGLRLDTPEGAHALLEGSDTIRAIFPGDPDASEALARMVSRDPDEMMPPPDFHKEPLTAREVALVRRWIEQGAVYERHWSFEPVKRPELPKVATANPIDAFILERLEREGLAPSPIANKATLLRRLSLDLTGLPPTPEELDAFLADQSPDAWNKQVERLLASPHYGERMAVSWLDVARYADTVGYHGDQNSRIFPYRDYVIASFNKNKPFDQFTREQLAGDLLPNPTEEQHIATGFLRLNLMTREGGAQAEEYMAKYMGDRIRALGGAWLGLTTGCAECHDHKFDPITAKDYYSLGAFFADIRQWGVYSHYGNQPNPDFVGRGNEGPFPPEILTRNPALLQSIAALRHELNQVLASAGKPGDDAAFNPWTAAAAGFLNSHPTGWATLTASDVSVSGGNPSLIREDGSVVINGAPKENDKVTVRLPLPNLPLRSIRFEAQPDPSNNGKVGRDADGHFSVKPEFAIEGAPKPLAIAWAQADRRRAHKFTNEGQIAPRLEDEWRSGPDRMEFPLDAASHPQQAIYHLATPLPAEEGRVLVVTLHTADLGRARFSFTPFGGAIPADENAHRPELADAFKAMLVGRISDSQQREILAAYILGTTPEDALPPSYARVRDAILACRAGFAHSMVAETLPADKIATVRFLPRGDWMNPGDAMQPAFPEFLAGKPQANGKRLNRLDLANWLMSPDNPLPSRQFTNRLWRQFFGRGLSANLDDLGSQGEMPSHPDLLDWLASEFRESGWDVKHMVRLMVTSDTYRREAATREDLLEKDPANRLLAGQAARRLDAEFIRDHALAVSGLLQKDIIGGPSARPYQPEGYYENLMFPDRDYHASTGSDQFRRGLYMHWQRTFLHPMLAAFDAPSREECTAERFQANTPQQALALLNDPSFVEAARAFAQRLIRELPDAKDDARIGRAIKLALSRDPRDGEVSSLSALLEKQRALYQKDPEAAKALIAIGQTGASVSGDPAELAAWTQFCRVILNLHETITRF
jgi:Protein of unknown function (DUF1553)/Protein of unknown function (DUF1549)/Planctomycete cytochrome C